jgi:hypothetical protein
LAGLALHLYEDGKPVKALLLYLRRLLGGSAPWPHMPLGFGRQFAQCSGVEAGPDRQTSTFRTKYTHTAQQLGIDTRGGAGNTAAILT